MRSDGADVAGIARYFTARLLKFLNLWADDFHQDRGQLYAVFSMFCMFILKSFPRRQADRGCAAVDVFVGGEGAFGQKGL
jgi:hypothetical protein